MEALQYPPHLSFAIYDSIDPQKLFDAVDSAFRHCESVTVRFDRLGYFEGPHAIILWAAPVLPERLQSVHDHVHTSIDVNLCRPNYRPGKWTPHCSLALSIDLAMRQQALALVAQSIKPFEVLFDVADCASFLPVYVLHEIRLCGA